MVNKKNIKVVAYKSYTHRISKMIVKLNKAQGRGRLQVLQVYATTLDASEDDIDQFYNTLQVAIDENRFRYTIIIRDFNGKVGRDVGKTFESVDKFNHQKMNERCLKLKEFTESNGMYITNTFCKNLHRKNGFGYHRTERLRMKSIMLVQIKKNSCFQRRSR